MTQERSPSAKVEISGKSNSWAGTLSGGRLKFGRSFVVGVLVDQEAERHRLFRGDSMVDRRVSLSWRCFLVVCFPPNPVFSLL